MRLGFVIVKLSVVRSTTSITIRFIRLENAGDVVELQCKKGEGRINIIIRNSDCLTKDGREKELSEYGLNIFKDR